MEQPSRSSPLILDSKYIQHPIGDGQTVLFWIDFTPDGAIIRPYIRGRGYCHRATLDGLSVEISTTERAQVLQTLQNSAVDVYGRRVTLLPQDPLSLYWEWKQQLPTASPEERPLLSLKIEKVEVYANALLTGQLNEDRPAAMIACNNLGNAYLNLGELRGATTCFNKVLSLAITLGRRDGMGIAYGNLGNAYLSLGQYEKAIEFHEKRLLIAKEIGDRVGEGRAYGNLGVAYRSLGQYEKAIEFQEKRLLITKETGDRRGEGQTYGNLGNAYTSLGQYEKAIEFHVKDLLIAKEVGDRHGEGQAYENLGNAYTSLGQYKKGIEFHEKHLAVAKEIGDRKGEGNAYGNLGVDYRSLGQYEKAIEFYEKHLLIAKEVGDRQGEGNAYGNLGNAYNSLGRYEKAIEFHKKRLLITKEIGDRKGEGASYGNLGNAYTSLGRYEKAIEFYEKDLLIAREIGDRHGEGGTYGNLGVAYGSLGQYEKAIGSHKKDLLIAKEIGNRHGEGTAYGNLGVAHESNNQPEEAEAAFRQAIEIYSKLQHELGADKHSWKISIFETLFRPYRNLEKLLVKQSRYEEALEIADQGRARALAALIEGKVSASLSVKDMQSLAEKLKTTLIYYSLDVFEQDKAVAWIISPGKSIAFETLEVGETVASLFEESKALESLTEGKGRGLAKSLRARGQQLNDELESPVDPQKMHNQLQQWHQALIAPLLPHLPTKEGARVAIISDYALHSFPFAILRDPDGKYLVEKYTLFTAPSLEVLKRLMERPKSTSQGKPLVIADPEHNLIGSYQEGVRLSKSLVCDSLIRGKATLENVKGALTTASLIHFTGHGTDEKTNPQSVFGGALLLHDGLLPAEEIVDLDIKADLAILNGCRTGKGEQTLEGVIGPPHAFLGAGCSTVIGTQWVVQDQLSKNLMINFHKKVNMSRAEALREAMLEAMKIERESPWKWGAFFLIGLP